MPTPQTSQMPKDEFFGDTQALSTTEQSEAEIAASTLENISLTRNIVLSDMARVILDIRKQEATRENLIKAEKEARQLSALKRRELMSLINESRLSPTISRDTQLAHLKGLLLDFEMGVYRPGLDAKIIPKLIETINKMMGYEAPIQHEVKSEQKILVFPVTSESFRGELPPLDLQTMKSVDATIVDDKPDLSTQKSFVHPAHSTPQPRPAQPPSTQPCPDPQTELTSSSLEIS